MVSSLRFWLISSFSIVLLICLIAIWLFISSINTSKKLENYHSVLKTTRILLLENNKLKEDVLIGDFNDSGFYTSSLSAPEKKFKNINRKINNYISYLEKSNITEFNSLREKIDKIEDLLHDYNKTYDELIYLYKLKGFKDYGLEGKMRNYAHRIYDFDNRDVKFYCLTLRKHEKDFLMRKDLAYVLAFGTVVKEFIEFINEEKNISQHDKNLLINDIYHYNKLFNLLARIDSKLGIKGKNGYLNKSKQIFDNIAYLIELVDNDLKIIENKHKEELKRNTIIVVIILIAFLVAAIVILTQLITKSVKSVSESFSNYVNSGFNYESVNFRKSKIKEFNAIYASFLKMAKEINIFTNFFREKVHERTLAINQQKDEILSQQHQIQSQYQVLLAKNKELEVQRHLLAIKNNDTQQSLRYAKRIQKAIQPGSSKFKEYFSDSFVFAKAKDVISGDFYLVYKNAFTSPGNASEKITFISADCTGHGVPGAIMSVLGINTINKLVKELKNTDPGKILNLLNKDINQVLAHGKKEMDIVADGMDIAVFTFDTASYQLEYSIARFSHYLVRDSQVFDLKTQKSAIGYSFFDNDSKNFETSSLQLKQGDCLYLFSDGFGDQFGGPQNKKYKRKNIRGLIERIHTLPMLEQKNIFKNEFTTWKKSFAQIDDVLVIGIRF